jgi:hypothetical protein
MALALLAVVGIAIFAGVAVLAAAVGFVLRAVLFLVLLPFKLLFFALGLPLLIVGSVGAVVLTAVAGSLLLVAGILAAVVGSALAPLALVAFAIWALVRLSRRPVAA